MYSYLLYLYLLVITRNVQASIVIDYLQLRVVTTFMIKYVVETFTQGLLFKEYSDTQVDVFTLFQISVDKQLDYDILYYVSS